MLRKEDFRIVPDFPKEGIQFIDVTSIMNNGSLFESTIYDLEDRLAEKFDYDDVDVIVGIESRGFIFGAALAALMGIRFVPARKAGKLPGETVKGTYQLEYGSDTIEIHKSDIIKGDKVVIVDDLLATGGTVSCVSDMLKTMGAIVKDCLFVCELSKLGGRKKLEDQDLTVDSLVDFADIY